MMRPLRKIRASLLSQKNIMNSQLHTWIHHPRTAVMPCGGGYARALFARVTCAFID